MIAAVVCVLFFVPATVAAEYYALFATLGWRKPRPVSGTTPRTRFAVLVPAHDEELGLPRTLAAIAAADYPPELLHVLVVADNCTDGTAAVARAAGVGCVERADPLNRGKGYALAYGLPAALADGPDAVLVLDADCTLDAAAFRVLDAEFAAGADAVQLPVKMGDPNAGPSGLVMAAGSEIENAVQAGLSAMGRAVRLRGTGMAFRRSVLERCGWNAFGLAEDAEYGATLERAGVRVRFAAGAGVRNTPPVGVADLCKQRARWRDALFVGSANWLDRAVTSKPLVLAHLGLTAAATQIPGIPTEFTAWVAVLVAVQACIYARAVVRTGASVAAILGLWRTPAVVARLAVVTAAGFVTRAGTWDRTPRVA
ncbi:MAG: glycosyltransferase family 2 protein [Fimbriiglobus sp.]